MKNRNEKIAVIDWSFKGGTPSESSGNVLSETRMLPGTLTRSLDQIIGPANLTTSNLNHNLPSLIL